MSAEVKGRPDMSDMAMRAAGYLSAAYTQISVASGLLPKGHPAKKAVQDLATRCCDAHREVCEN